MKRMRKCNDEVCQLAKDQALDKKLKNKRLRPFCLCLPGVMFVTRGSKTSKNSYRFMTYYSSLQNLLLFTSSIDFNVVNPSNNTFNRQKIIITIFVNETKCFFEKN